MTLRPGVPICYRCNQPALKFITIKLLTGEKYVCSDCYLVNFRKAIR